MFINVRLIGMPDIDSTDFYSKKSNAEELDEEEVKEEGPYDWIMHLQKQRANV